jgi:SAM-dependent methyltransferase
MAVTVDAAWLAYLDRFHAAQPGITERILTRCRSDGIDPYQWCAEPLAGRDGPMLDVACGSGPLADRMAGWIGVDVSPAELAAAATRGRRPLVRSSADRLPFGAASTGAVTCSMAMQVIQPVAAAVAEVARVLHPGGRAVLLLPASGPLSLRQKLLYLRTQAALRRRVGYPNDRALAASRLAPMAAASGFRVGSDERRGFSLPIDSGAQADELVESLYLPGVDPRRLRRAGQVLGRHVGGELIVPLRRVVLDRGD